MPRLKEKCPCRFWVSHPQVLALTRAAIFHKNSVAPHITFEPRGTRKAISGAVALVSCLFALAIAVVCAQHTCHAGCMLRTQKLPSPMNATTDDADSLRGRSQPGPWVAHHSAAPVRRCQHPLLSTRFQVFFPFFACPHFVAGSGSFNFFLNNQKNPSFALQTLPLPCSSWLASTPAMPGPGVSGRLS